MKSQAQYLAFIFIFAYMNPESVFTKAGGTFCIPYAAFHEKLSRIKAFIFDWDGVFNDGSKDHQGSSNFSEVDSMGTNLLRFSRWLSKKEMPFCAVMSGEKNQLSFQFTQREHFHQGYFKVIHKTYALDHFLALHSLQADEVAFLFDDVLDLSVAARVGLRLMVGRKGNPLFRQYVEDRKLADYITAQDEFAVRESCELLIGATGNFDEVLDGRSSFSPAYQHYLAQRQSIDTGYFTLEKEEIKKADL